LILKKIFKDLGTSLPFLNSIFQKINGSWKEILGTGVNGILGFEIEKEKTNSYHNIITESHFSASEIFVVRYKWNSLSLQYEEDKEWAEKWGHVWP